MTTSEFEIEIVEQHWLPTMDEDLCSHGTVRVSIGGVVVPTGDDDLSDLGISRAALELLRTLDRDRIADSPSKILPHGCGFLSIAASCPIGIDWSVRHVDQSVTLDAVVVEPVISRPRRIDARATLPWTAYRDAVVTFARAAVEFVEASPKKLPNDQWDRDDFERWRAESLELIGCFEAASTSDKLLSRQGPTDET
jgi:hypothetical protein